MDKHHLKKIALEASEKYDLDKGECYRFFSFLNTTLINLMLWRDVTISIPKLFRTEFTKKGKHIAILGRREKSKRQRDYAKRMY